MAKGDRPFLNISLIKQAFQASKSERVQVGEGRKREEFAARSGGVHPAAEVDLQLAQLYIPAVYSLLSSLLRCTIYSTLL